MRERIIAVSVRTVATIAFVALSACGSADDPQILSDATTPSAGMPSTAEISIATIPPGIYAVDRDHTYLTFSYLHLGYSYPQLRFSGIDGELDLAGEALAGSSVAIAIETDSLDTKLPRFDRELKSLQYFNAEDYPTIAFMSQGYEPATPTSGSLAGDLTIKGRTRPVVLDVTINNAIQHPMKNVPAIGFSATGTLLRSEWGLSRNIPFVADEVTINIEIEFLYGASQASSAAAVSAREITAGVIEE